MNDTSTLASAPHLAPREPCEELTDVPRRHSSLATLRSMVATWRWRKRFRWELDQKTKANPHLIDDMGLTMRQVEAEIAKPFWRR